MRKITFLLSLSNYCRIISALLALKRSLRPIAWGLLASLLGCLGACEKLVDVPAPPTSIPQTYVFATDQEAISAVAGAYYRMVNSNVATLSNGGMTIYTGLASDELVLFDQGNAPAMQFYQNSLQANNPVIGTNLWESPYQIIYQFNAILEGVQASATLSAAIKDQLTGQALFGRALLHYHLSTVFGDVPYITSTNWRTTTMQQRMPIVTIYGQLIADLQRAQQLLPAAYTLLPDGRTAANKWAVAALLAKLYAAINNWQQVLTECNQVISSGDYQLAVTPAEVFKINSPEAILQLQQDNTAYAFNATREGMTLLPIDVIFPFPPFASLSPSLLAAFEPDDLRLNEWTSHREINGTLLHYPAKYKVGPSQAEPGASLTEGYMILRLAEVLLLRAEARMKQGDLTGALEDLNTIRYRAGLPDLPAGLSPQQVQQAMEQERRIELFCEWGNRWQDLWRWNTAAQVLTAHKGYTVGPQALLFPIPATELLTNPALEQNPGY